MAKKEGIRKLFDNIAPDYDKLNHILSLNIDKGFSLWQFFFYIHLHLPPHHITNRQKEKSFCRFCKHPYENSCHERFFLFFSSPRNPRDGPEKAGENEGDELDQIGRGKDSHPGKFRQRHVREQGKCQRHR